MDRITHTALPPRARRQRQSRLLSVMTVFVCVLFTFLHSLIDWAEFVSLNNLVAVEKEKQTSHYLVLLALCRSHLSLRRTQQNPKPARIAFCQPYLKPAPHFVIFTSVFTTKNKNAPSDNLTKPPPKSTEIWHGRNAKAGSCISSSCVLFLSCPFACEFLEGLTYKCLLCSHIIWEKIRNDKPP